MKTKGELKNELDVLIRRLKQQYFLPDAPGFPTPAELDSVTTLIAALGKAIGRKYFGPTHFWGVVKALDKHYSGKLGIKDFFDKLVDKLVLLPKCPLAQIKNLLQAGGASDATQLKELAKLIEGYDLKRDYTKVDWAALYKTILPFTTKSFQALAEKSLGSYHFDYGFQAQPFNNAFGYAAFADVQMQRLFWELEYESVFKETASRVYFLQSPEYDQRLRAAFCGEAQTLEHLKKAHKSAVTRDRQRKHRAPPPAD